MKMAAEGLIETL